MYYEVVYIMIIACSTCSGSARGAREGAREGARVANPSLQFSFAPPNCPPPKMVSICANTSYGFTQFQNMANLLTVIIISCLGVVKFAVWMKVRQVLLKQSCPPQKISLPSTCPPPHLCHPGAATEYMTYLVT